MSVKWDYNADIVVSLFKYWNGSVTTGGRKIYYRRMDTVCSLVLQPYGSGVVEDGVLPPYY